MARPCSVCNHPKRSLIEQQVLLGQPVATVAREHGLTHTSLKRHLDNHVLPRVRPENLPAPTRHLVPREEIERSEVALQDLRLYEPRMYFLRQLQRAERVAEQAEGEGASGAMLNAIEASRRLYNDAIHLFASAEPGPSDDTPLLQRLDDVAKTPEEREVLGRLLLKLESPEPSEPVE